MSGTRPRRFLSQSQGATSPRRSDRIKESPTIDYSPSLKKSSQTRSRSKSRVLRDSHGLDRIDENELQTAKRRLELNPRIGLDCLSDNEDEVDSERKSKLKRVNTMDVIGSVGGFPADGSVSRLQARLSSLWSDSVSELRNFRVPDKQQVKEYMMNLSLKRLISAGLILILLILLIYTLFAHSDKISEISALLLSPVLSTISYARLALLSVPELFHSRRVEVIGSTPVDYDTLVNKILTSERFNNLIEELSLQHRSSLENKIQDEISGLQVRSQEIDQKMSNEIRTEIDLLKTWINSQNVQVKSAMEDQSNENLAKFDAMTASLAALEAKMLELDQMEKTQHDASNTDVSALTAQIQTVRNRLSEVESKIPEVRSQIKSCCSDKPDLKAELESRLQQIFSNNSSNVMQAVSTHFITRSEMETDRDQIDRQLNILRDDLINKVKSESDTLNVRLEDLVAQVRAVQDDAAKQNTSPQISDPQRLKESDYVERMVKQALAKYDADKTGMFDFALESAGGSIASTRCTESYEGSSAVLSVMGIPIWYESNNPRTILQPGMAPGQCWAFAGSTGAVVVKLSKTIEVKSVSIEHISLLSTPDGQISSAPRTMSLAGVIGDSVVPLANFTYERSGDPVQTFQVTSSPKLDTVELSILSNHGHPEYTCLYRFRVHGEQAEDEKIH